LSEPDFVLKHRIVGALILIGFGVVVLPWILGGPESTGTATVTEPAQANANNEDDNTKVFVSRITPIGGATPPVLAVKKDQAGQADNTAAAITTTAVEPEKTAKKKPEVTATSATPEKTVTTTATKSAAPKPTTKVAKAAPELTRGWVVRIGTFSKPENAKRVMGTLRTKGFDPQSGKYKTKSGAATRVWVGPYAKRVEAARVRTRIERVTGEKGLITPYP
jgi:DedD protein